MSFPIMSFMKSRKALNFDGTNYLILGYHAEFELQNFEYEWQGVFEAGSNRVWGINSSEPSSRSGHWLVFKTPGQPFFQYTIGSSSTGSIFHTTLTENLEDILVTSKFKKFGTSYEFTINGIMVSGTIPQTILYSTTNPEAGTYIGRRALPSTALPYLGTMNYCRYYELNASGDRIADLINIDKSNDNGTEVPNTAANAPSGSDAVWVTS